MEWARPIGVERGIASDCRLRGSMTWVASLIRTQLPGNPSRSGFPDLGPSRLPDPPAGRDDPRMPDEPHDRSRWAQAALTCTFAVGLVALALARIPSSLLFEGFAFADWGANLTAQKLLDAGLRPTVDFTYPYGLLPLATGRLWFGWLGLEPQAYFHAGLCCHVVVAAAMAGIVVRCRAGWAGAALVAVMLPYLVPSIYSNLAHAMETALLAAALWAQADRRRGSPLALVALAAFCKPSMAYVYGLLLVGRDLARHTSGSAANEPRRPSDASVATAVVAILSLGLGAWFGLEPLTRSLLPLGTASHYRAMNYGFFFGSGRNYWLPPDATIGHYFGTQRGWWLVATAVLIAAGAREVLMRRPGLVATTATLHAAFICLFFGNELSWQYYVFIPIAGLVALAGSGRWGRRVVWGLVALGLFSVRGVPGEIRGQWLAFQPVAALSNLWTSTEAAGDWAAARPYWAGRNAVVLSWSGHAALLDRGFAPDVRLFLMPGFADAPDIERQAEQLRQAEVIIVPTSASQSFHDFLTRDCEPLAAAIKGCTPIHRGRSVVVYQHAPTAPEAVEFEAEAAMR